MEQNLPLITKKIWKIIRVVYFMLRKGISKGKLLADLTSLMKRGKIAGKAAIQNLMFHHHPVAGRPAGGPPNAYEFSCSNSPIVFGHFTSKRKNSGAATPPFDFATVAAALALPGFGPSPMVRQLRITDSPYPLRDLEEDNHVDEAAEEFIMKFYKDLKKQNAYLGYS
ncbi:hypothetical protein PHJA_000709600 [Phtheirospermum japonicum]|uniref:Avr9/Cf-9 rapidly elicited protein 146 n=1 Tax=Phtheirospermum japonicum TaxID=374723 RepID=A0A830BJQ3_9LAMI|nr:hypothetical protein PHJA_000709600 [Phtheirospermum japonicum]